MKRSEMIDKLVKILPTKLEFVPKYNTDLYCPNYELANTVLYLIEEAGMLPPLSTVKVIPDHERPGKVKHSESKREWDEE